MATERESDLSLELHRDRCDELRELVDDLSQIWGPSCKELLLAIDAFEREPALRAELDAVRRELEQTRKAAPDSD